MGLMRFRLVSYGIRAAVGATLACLIACGMASSDALSADRGGESPGASDGAGSTNPNAPTADAGQGSPTATGIIVVHAAVFPSFRLCFSNHLEDRPQPDSKVMPEANSVGVEVGSVVRIGGLDNPGKVYVIHRKLAGLTNDPNEPTCRKLICEDATGKPIPNAGDNCLAKNSQFFEAGEITSTIGKTQVDALALRGCGGEGVVSQPQFAGFDYAARCGYDGYPYKTLTGNLKTEVVTLTPTTTTATDKALPVQLVHFAPYLDAARGAGVLDVTFGKLTPGDGGAGDAGVALSQPVETNPKLFATGTQQTLKVEQQLDPFFGENGFRIALRPSAGAAPSFVAEQTLAKIQELSSPASIPSTYFKAASNYALLLLGDPVMKPTLANGDPNPDFDERRSVHVIAVPIIEKAADGGAPEAGSTTTGDGG